MRRSFASFRDCRRGATAVEYSLIAALLAVVLISGLQLFSDSVEVTFTVITDAVLAVIQAG